MEEEIIYLEGQAKLNIRRKPFNGITMDDYDFSIEVYCVPDKRICFPKQQCIRKDENCYAIPIDSKKLGIGRITVRVISKIPDPDFKVGYRVDVDKLVTKYRIKL